MTFVVSLLRALLVGAIVVVAHAGLAYLFSKTPMDLLALFAGVVGGAMCFLPWGIQE